MGIGVTCQQFGVVVRTFAIASAAAMLVLGSSAQAQSDKDGNAPAMVTVKVPVSSEIERRGKFSGFNFQFVRNTSRNEVAAYERLNVKELADGTLQFHRRNDNGVAGSGVVANVKFTRDEAPTEVTMTFEELSSSTYQEGLFLKKAIPQYSLKSVLLAGTVSAKFEVNSDFAVEAIRANFQRLSVRSGPSAATETYRIKTAVGPAYVDVQFFPYRNGAKVTVSSLLPAHETSPGVIDFGVLLKELEAAVTGIVQS